MFDPTTDRFAGWSDPKTNPAVQMEAQAEAALAAGRVVEWHAQTEKGYRGLTKIREICAGPETCRDRHLRSELSGGSG